MAVSASHTLAAVAKPSQAQLDKLMEGFSRPQGLVGGGDRRGGGGGGGRFGGGGGRGDGGGNPIGRFRVPPAGGRDGAAPSARIAGESLHPTKTFEPGMSYTPADLDWSNAKEEPLGPDGKPMRPKRPWHKYPLPGADIRDDDARTMFEPFNVALLAKFVNPQGKIMKRQQSGLTAKSQRKVAKAIKTSRQLGLMPYNSRPRIQRY